MNVSKPLTDQEKQEISESVAEALLKGTNENRITRRLIRQGWYQNKSLALSFVNEVKENLDSYRESPEVRQAMSDYYRRRSLWGILALSGGTGVTAISFLSASPGDTFVLAYGAILYGGYLLWDGATNSSRYRIRSAEVNCPKCNAQLILDDSETESGQFVCPKCNFVAEVEIKQ